MFPCGNSQLGLPGCIQNIDIQSIRKNCRRIKKHIETYVNYPFQQTTIISNWPWFPHHFRKKNTLRPFFCVNKKQQWEKSRAKTKNPLSHRGAANRRGWRRCCQGFWARWRAQRRQTGAAGRTDQQPRGVHGGETPKPPATGVWLTKEPGTRVYWQRSWAKRHGKNFLVNIGLKAKKLDSISTS